MRIHGSFDWLRELAAAAVLLAALLPAAVSAGSRGDPSVCAGLPDGRGICNAYCERLDCPHKVPRSCARLRERFLKKTGSSIFPCDAAPCTGDERTVLLTTGPATKLDVGFSGIDHRMPFIDDAELELGLCCEGDACVIQGAPAVGASFLAPVPVSAGGVPFCLVNSIRGSVTGTYDCGTGCASANVPLTVSVFLRNDIAKPCPVCVGDATANDGVKGGACDGGATPGGACDANGTSPLFGTTSNDCLPEIDVADLSIDLAPLTTGTASLVANTDCAAFGLPSGACHCPGQVLPNPCLDFTCSPGGVCENGPTDGICSGQPFRFCISDQDCEETFPGAGTCTTVKRACFPSTITATGQCDPEGGTLASVFCFPATRAPAVNVVAGLPGPARITLPVSTDGCQ